MSEEINVFTPKQLEDLTKSKSNSGFDMKGATNLIKELNTLLTTWGQAQTALRNFQGQASPEQSLNANVKYEKGFEQGQKIASKGILAINEDGSAINISNTINLYIDNLDETRTVKEIKEEIKSLATPENLKPYVVQFIHKFARVESGA